MGDELRDLYRDIVRYAHPDRAPDGPNKERRQRVMTRIMARANVLYEAGDYRGLEYLWRAIREGR